jgi:hypothetical protein
LGAVSSQSQSSALDTSLRSTTSDVTWRTRSTTDCSSMVDVGVGTDEDEGGMYMQLMMKGMNQCYPCSSSDPMNEVDVNCEPRMSLDAMDRQMMIMAQRMDTATNDASSFSAIDNSIMPSHWPSFHRLQQSASQDRSIISSINLSTTQSIDLLNDNSSIDVHKNLWFVETVFRRMPFIH